MTTFDFTPLFRSTVGFDLLMNLLEDSPQWSDGNGYPPYNIEKTATDAYRVTVAVAGFSQDELTVDVRENVLTVEGRKREGGNGQGYLYRGIAGRSSKRTFQLADHVKAVGASLENGLLTVDLVRELPEAMKPRRIPIATGAVNTVAEQKPDLVTDETTAAA